MKLPIYQVDAFTQERFKGNSAAVVPLGLVIAVFVGFLVAQGRESVRRNGLQTRRLGLQSRGGGPHPGGGGGAAAGRWVHGPHPRPAAGLPGQASGGGDGDPRRPQAAVPGRRWYWRE